jgi:hypothetical protein
MNKKMASRLQELGFDPNRPISKYELLQVEGNKNLHPTAPASSTGVEEVETTPEWDLFITPPFAMKQEQWNEYVEDLNKAQEDKVPQELVVEPVLEAEQPKVEVPPEKPKNALKELEKFPKKPVSVKKKKSKKETS